MLDQAAAALREAGKTAVPEFRNQHPAEGLVRMAEENGGDLVVVGRQGLSKVERFLIGSVSTHVLRHAPCSVVIVPGPAA